MVATTTMLASRQHVLRILSPNNSKQLAKSQTHRHLFRLASSSSSKLFLEEAPQKQTTSSSIHFAALAVAASAATLSWANGPRENKSATLMESKSESDSNDDEASESTTILNWSGTHSVELAQGKYHEPETMAELIDLVSKSYQEGFHIRPVGSALSPNGIAFDSRGMVGLSNLDKIIEINKEEMTVTVEAGARVSQVLDALRPHGLTLPNLASIAEQQIGGFVSVGAHGTGAKIPPCDEFVTGLTLVTPSRFGVVKMTEESHGNLFRLARLGLGGLGVLGEVTLRVIPAHRLVEQTIVMTRSEARQQLSTLLKRHKHIRYMWIPYTDAVVVVTNDDENDLPLLGAGTEIADGKGSRKKIVTEKDLESEFTKDEQLEPLRRTLKNLLKNSKDISLDEETIRGMGFGDLRDNILALGNMLDPDHIKHCNKAELEFWKKAQGIQVAPSDQKLQFDCGGQQLVYEVCYPVGTYGLPNSNSVDFVEELLKEIESSGIPAPSPIEQRWTAPSRSPLSPAFAGSHENGSYDTKNALFSWVGVIQYLPSEDFDPTGFRREFITEYFSDKYCKLVRKVGEKYGLMCHWAKLEVSDDPSVVPSVRARLGSQVIAEYNAARDMFDPKRMLSSPLVDKIFGSDGDK